MQYKYLSDGNYYSRSRIKLGIGTYRIVFPLRQLNGYFLILEVIAAAYPLQDPSYKKVRVANFHRATVESCVELMEATGLKSWAAIHPRHVTRRVALGDSRPYHEIFEHLQVKQGDLLAGKGPKLLQSLWHESLGGRAAELTSI